MGVVKSQKSKSVREEKASKRTIYFAKRLKKISKLTVGKVDVPSLKNTESGSISMERTIILPADKTLVPTHLSDLNDLYKTEQELATVLMSCADTVLRLHKPAYTDSEIKELCTLYRLAIRVLLQEQTNSFTADQGLTERRQGLDLGPRTVELFEQFFANSKKPNAEERIMLAIAGGVNLGQVDHWFDIKNEKMRPVFAIRAKIRGNGPCERYLRLQRILSARSFEI
ncbi:MAG: hypothetical protein M1834_003410 [Cirrosporium novae-zelandiae]|nr:MAG: hypothetical protein M1834_003410 [Cirrosporium novae-zelandiae]